MSSVLCCSSYPRSLLQTSMMRCISEEQRNRKQFGKGTKLVRSSGLQWAQPQPSSSFWESPIPCQTTAQTYMSLSFRGEREELGGLRPGLFCSQPKAALLLLPVTLLLWPLLAHPQPPAVGLSFTSLVPVRMGLSLKASDEGKRLT